MRFAVIECEAGREYLAYLVNDFYAAVDLADDDDEIWFVETPRGKFATRATGALVDDDGTPGFSERAARELKPYLRDKDDMPPVTTG